MNGLLVGLIAVGQAMAVALLAIVIVWLMAAIVGPLTDRMRQTKTWKRF